MGYRDGAVSRPQEGFLTETLALGGALLLGRRRIFADYFTGTRLGLLLLILALQWVLVLAGIVAVRWFVLGTTLSPAIKAGTLNAHLVWSLGIWAVIAARVLYGYSRARREARIVPTRPGEHGTYVYDLKLAPDDDDFARHLDAHLRLGVSRPWQESALARYAPPLRSSAFRELRWSAHALWTWTVQEQFEPNVLIALALVCFCTANPCFLFLAAAAIALESSTEATRHWFEREGYKRFMAAEEERQEAERRRREAAERAAEEERRNFVVQVPRPSEEPVSSGTSVAEAQERLPDELRRLVGG